MHQQGWNIPWREQLLIEDPDGFQATPALATSATRKQTSPKLKGNFAILKCVLPDQLL
jgi:hypothetical protein